MKSYRSFTPKTFSQNVARFFEYGCYLLFIPGILALGVSCLIPYFLIVSVPSIAIGIALFIGYLKHSRDDLSDGKILLMWIGTFFFNITPMSLAIYSQMLEQTGDLRAVTTYLLISWWFTTTLLSAGAFISELWKR